MHGSGFFFSKGEGGGLRDICLIGGLGHFFGYFLCNFKKSKFSDPQPPPLVQLFMILDPGEQKKEKGDRSSHCPRSIEEENSFYD